MQQSSQTTARVRQYSHRLPHAAAQLPHDYRGTAASKVVPQVSDLRQFGLFWAIQLSSLYTKYTVDPRLLSLSKIKYLPRSTTAQLPHGCRTTAAQCGCGTCSGSLSWPDLRHYSGCGSCAVVVRQLRGSVRESVAVLPHARGSLTRVVHCQRGSRAVAHTTPHYFSMFTLLPNVWQKPLGHPRRTEQLDSLHSAHNTALLAFGTAADEALTRNFTWQSRSVPVGWGAARSWVVTMTILTGGQARISAVIPLPEPPAHEKRFTQRETEIVLACKAVGKATAHQHYTGRYLEEGVPGVILQPSAVRLSNVDGMTIRNRRTVEPVKKESEVLVVQWEKEKRQGTDYKATFLLFLRRRVALCHS
ncbi:hypothetical protein C8F01DRAFT_1342812 [Mycena amicta]|nr:hypothetical protein C8F01DRAFT_1342812 [Mycena amicta]